MSNPRKISRRSFLKSQAFLLGASALGTAGGLLLPSKTDAFSFRGIPMEDSPSEVFLVEARHYRKLEHKKIRCELCPRECVVDDWERGYCGVRENRDGTYYTLVHSRPCTWHVDPIEKKPFFHFLPGTNAYSISTVGCNVECKFCQNWQISQIRPEQSRDFKIPPKEIARLAEESGSRSIAYTYAEPVVFYEYMYDCSVEGRKRGIRNVMVSNGYIRPEPMRELCEQLDAVKIDLKAYTEKFYREQVSGELKPVLDTLVLLREIGMWFEIVYLIIPTLNDGRNEIEAMCRWIISELGESVPVHFSRFWPQYKLKNLPPTPVRTLEEARDIALNCGIHFAYIGNVPGHKGENTYCPGCGATVVRRTGYNVHYVRVKDGKCLYCGHPIPGVWE